MSTDFSSLEHTIGKGIVTNDPALCIDIEILAGEGYIEKSVCLNEVYERIMIYNVLLTQTLNNKQIFG